MTPRPYISYGQLILWERSPDEYMAKYFAGKVNRINRGMALGKEIATALENGEETGDFAKDFVIAQLPKYDLADVSITVSMNLGKKNIVPVLIKPDSIKKDLSALYEYKTGEIPWTQKKVDNDGQITFYATGCWIEKKKIPVCELIWAPTATNDEGKPELTGEIKRFPTIRRMSHILGMMSRIQKAWREINERCDAELI